MLNISFYYTLDVTYKPGVDHRVVKREREEGKDIGGCYSEKETSIYLSWSLAGTYNKVLIGAQKIKPCDFDFAANLPKRKLHYDLSVLLQSIKSRIEKEYLNMRTNEQAVTPDSIREMVRGIINGPVENASEKKGLFWRVFNEFIEEKKLLTKPSTVTKYKALQKILLAFERTMKFPLSFETINARWYNKFMIYSTGPDVRHKNNTIAKNVRMVKCIMNYGYDMKYHRHLDFKRFRGEEDTTDPIFLTQEELALIEGYDAGEGSTISLSRDIFLTGCRTGARVSDLMQMRKRNLKLSKDGTMEFENFQVKGRKVKCVKIFIVEPARRILDKYLMDKNEDDYVFPRIAPATVNRKLKILGELAGITMPVTKVNYSGKNRIEETQPKFKYLTTHVGRKTFISLLCEDNMPDHEIMAMSGHSSSKEMRNYKGVNRSRVREGMKRVFEKQ